MTQHDSDCATHNEPAYPAGECDCEAGAVVPPGFKRWIPEDWLEPYVNDSEEMIGCMWIHHKFYVGIAMPLMHDEQRLPEDAIRLKAVHAQEAMDEGNYDQYIWQHERPYRAEALYDVKEEVEGMDLTDDERWQILGPLCIAVWTDSENINQNLHIWEEMFYSIPGYHWMRPEDRDAMANFPETFEIWRGVCDDGGFSWSLSEKVARFFANRGVHNATGEVVSRMVSKSEVFAYTDGRSEQEVLIIPETPTGEIP